MFCRFFTYINGGISSDFYQVTESSGRFLKTASSKIMFLPDEII
jgi:hypothetical protein